LIGIRRAAATCVRRHLPLAGLRRQNWRAMKTFKTRHQFYLPDDLSEKLEALAADPGSSKTAILTDAFRAWLEHRGATELDERFGVRLDRLSRADERLEHKLDFVAEALGTFVQHQLTLLAHQPAFDQETGQLGLQRYRAFVEMVGRRVVRPDQSSIALAMSNAGEDRNG
jgi:hypothetical protein